MRKESKIRKNDTSSCPFGLQIPFACKYAGQHVDKMAPLDIMDKNKDEGLDDLSPEKKAIAKANTKLLSWNLLRSGEKPCKCPYAGMLFDKKNDLVECNYEDSAPGQSPIGPLMPPPFYSKVFESSINGLKTMPVGYYSDYDVSRNLFFGTYSLQGSAREDMIKRASKEIADTFVHMNNLE